jgi:outer membrane protein assembly factor BamE (lipoprotein component of BamABCDE complex)
MKKTILFSILLLAFAFTMMLSSCNVLKCKSYANKIIHNAEKTTLNSCVECEVKNENLKNYIIKITKK